MSASHSQHPLPPFLPSNGQKPAKEDEYFPFADLRGQVGRMRVRETPSRLSAKINTLGLALMEQSEKEGRKNEQSLVTGEQATGAVAANRNYISISLPSGASTSKPGPSRRRRPTCHHQIAVLVFPTCAESVRGFRRDIGLQPHQK